MRKFWRKWVRLNWTPQCECGARRLRFGLTDISDGGYHSTVLCGIDMDWCSIWETPGGIWETSG